MTATSAPLREDGPCGLLGTFHTVRSARAGEVFRGVAFAPKSDDDDRDRHF